MAPGRQVSQERALLQRLFGGMKADVQDYGRLRELLDAQFNAALLLEGPELGELASRISELTALLEKRRRERVAIARRFARTKTGPVSMSVIAARLKGEARNTFNMCCAALEAILRECKELSARNGRLLMEQRDIMQRVLGREPDTYAPA